MPPGSASASNPAKPLSKGELDKYYSRVHVESVGSDGKKVLANVAGNLGNLLKDYKSALKAQMPGDDQAWTVEKSQEFLIDVIGQVKAILNDTKNALTDGQKQQLLNSLRKANKYKNNCNIKLEDVKKAPVKNGNVNLSASETVEKDHKEDHDGDRRLDRPPTSQDSTSRDKVHPPTTEKKHELNLRGITLKEDADPRVVLDRLSRLGKWQR